MLLLLACSGPVSISTDATDTDTDADADADADTDTDTTPVDTGPTDLDGDGSPAAQDCDDRDPDVHPGAGEAWNGVDDDCDGLTDADGAWSGNVSISASAVYEGRRYDFSLVCPFAGTRAVGAFDFAVTCTPDPTDEDAQRLLGATLVVTPTDVDVDGDTWDDHATWTSANGWDSRGDGTVTWSTFDAARVAISMAGVSLAASGSGALARE